MWGLGYSRAWGLTLIVVAGFAMPALASEDAEGLLRVPEALSSPQGNLSATELFDRGQAVFSHFNSPEEPDPQNELDDFAYRQSPAGIGKILPYLDPKGQFGRFFSITGSFNAYQDRDAKEVADFSVPLASDAKRLRAASRSFRARLRAAAKLPRKRALEGLRIALDPGHMGGADWDAYTGKFVDGPGGKRLSEGVLTLVTCLLLEKELESRGARVFLTRRTFDPVTSRRPEELDLAELGRRELREQGLYPWFQSLLERLEPGQELFDSVQSDTAYDNLFNEDARKSYFLIREELGARAAAIEGAFAPDLPDLTLIVHYDAHDPFVPSKQYDKTKAYVPGAFMPVELATRSERADFAKHLLDPDSWNASVSLSESILASLESRLGLEPDSWGGDEASQIGPGLFARNLVLSRKLSRHPVSYVEVLYYNSPTEFRSLSKKFGELEIGGQRVPYSKRLLRVAQALRDGILNFVKVTGS